MAVRGKEHDLKSSSLAEQFEFQSGRGLSPRHVEESCSCHFERLQRHHLVSLSVFFWRWRHYHFWSLGKYLTVEILIILILLRLCDRCVNHKVHLDWEWVKKGRSSFCMSIYDQHRTVIRQQNVALSSRLSLTKYRNFIVSYCAFC
jgi:hypothetical protein